MKCRHCARDGPQLAAVFVGKTKQNSAWICLAALISAADKLFIRVPGIHFSKRSYIIFAAADSSVGACSRFAAFAPAWPSNANGRWIAPYIGDFKLVSLEKSNCCQSQIFTTSSDIKHSAPTSKSSRQCLSSRLRRRRNVIIQNVTLETSLAALRESPILARICYPRVDLYSLQTFYPPRISGTAASLDGYLLEHH